MSPFLFSHLDPKGGGKTDRDRQTERPSTWGVGWGVLCFMLPKEAVTKVETVVLTLPPVLPPQVPGDLPHCNCGGVNIPSSTHGIGRGLWVLEEETHGK